ncbi:MAG: hypothetical protein ACYS0E_22920 [Planctomycetota bacterium]|jgi:hypothetical protein
MRLLAALLALVSLAIAGPGKSGQRDETHPRSPETPLEIAYEPYYCQLCLQEERIEPREQLVVIMRMRPEELAKELELDKGWLVIATPNFRILSTLEGSKLRFKDSVFAKADLARLQTIFPKLTIGREGAYLNPHQRAHLYHIRAERIYAHFAALTDNSTRFLGMPGPYHLMLFDDYADHHKYNDMFIGRANDKAGIQHHDRLKPNFMIFTTAEGQVARDKGKGDAVFNNHVIHNIAHNLMDGHGNYFRESWGWLEEGIGHYYERRENTKHNTFCWSEGKPPQSFLKPDWKSVIHSLVRRGKDPPLNQWCEKLQPGALTGTENGCSWSIVKWLVETDPVRFTKMVRKLDDYKNKPSSEECIKFAFGVSPTVLHQRWREYVLENYRKKR